MKEDFEKYWKNKFDNFEVEPNNNLWERLNDSLFEKQTQSIFRKYFVNPSKNVWRKIHFILWWKEFTRFSTTNFNIYYLLFSFFTATGIIFYSYRFENKQNSIKITSQPELQNINNTRSLASVLYNKYYNLDEHIKAVDEQSIFKQNTKKEDNNILIVQTPVYFDYIQELLPQSPSNYFSTNYLPLFIKRNVTYNLIKNSHAFTFYFSYVSSNNKLVIKKSETLKEIPYLKLLDSKSYSISAWYQYQQYNFSLTSGIVFQHVSQKYAYNNPIIFNDTIITQEIFDNSYYNYSYTQVLNLDTLLLTGDTVWFIHVDSTLVVNIDTLWNTEIKEIVKNRESRHYFSYKTIEIPVLFGYTQNYNRLAVTFKAGFSLSHTIITTGTFPSTTKDYGNMPFKRQQFNLLYLNSIFAIEAQYLLSEQWSLAIMPMYKQNITNLLENNSPFKLHTTSWFINIGLKYHLK